MGRIRLLPTVVSLPNALLGMLIQSSRTSNTKVIANLGRSTCGANKVHAAVARTLGRPTGAVRVVGNKAFLDDKITSSSLLHAVQMSPGAVCTQAATRGAGELSIPLVIMVSPMSAWL